MFMAICLIGEIVSIEIFYRTTCSNKRILKKKLKMRKITTYRQTTTRHFSIRKA